MAISPLPGRCNIHQASAPKPAASMTEVKNKVGRFHLAYGRGPRKQMVFTALQYGQAGLVIMFERNPTFAFSGAALLVRPPAGVVGQHHAYTGN